MKHVTVMVIIFFLSLTGCAIRRNPFNYFSQTHIYRTNDNSILLTFDDGPCENTRIILDMLKENNIAAAFFVVGKNAVKYPELVQRIIDEGHYLGSHSYTHPSFLNLSMEEAIEEVTKTKKIIAQYTSLRWFRPPFGELSYEMSRWLEKRNYQIIRWSAGAENAQPGDIVLMHETSHDLKMLPKIIESIKRQLN